MSKKTIRFGVIGCGLMGKEFASAVARWCHLTNVNFEPRIVAVCDANQSAINWFTTSVPSVKRSYTNYKDLLADEEVDAVYCAVPHNLHERIYSDIINAGKHLLGEKPFGIDKAANDAIMEAINANPGVVVRSSSEFPFFPGAFQISKWVEEGRFGDIIEVEAGFWHSSDLNPNKPINWKRIVASNGEYGCMGDLGLHVLHLPLRFGWKPNSVRALLSKVVDKRPDGKGGFASCETWDNGILACDVKSQGRQFPMMLSMKRIAPGHANTWFIRVTGTKMSMEYSTKQPKQIAYLNYEPGGSQAWHVEDVAYVSAYPTITGGIFEFGFSDSILQMWAAFCDEIVNGDQMLQSFRCATPEEAADSHRLFTAALESQAEGETIKLNWEG
ncbi:putative dehydrogenase [Paenibacillus taihuensis]|uniref:Putative dehydrogenase n=1 Tax=Paenibacillus taihuensis TaxID=1156355 RepID=A0A3D9RPS8_9BACL|nr:Gfo/Idh/MocA family oxidoreductase [Paenibacillus taihuensis]REE77694.1 putative dehydrogenase [Paenibacillus taihuensis]